MSHPDERRPLSELTTVGVGGDAERLLVATTREQLVRFASELTAADHPWCVLAGGSNVVFADEGYPGTVLLVRTSGIEEVDMPRTKPGSVFLRVQAGHEWDALVEFAVEQGLSGIEALSGIPGSAGAAPMQNIGAYGQELSSVLHSVEFFDTETGAIEEIRAFELDLQYRSSALKHERTGVVISILIELHRDARDGDAGDENRGSESLSQPVRYAQLANALGVELEERVPLREVREKVLALRAAKGMVFDPADPDTHSTGSFFMNPIVSVEFARDLPGDAPRWPVVSHDGVERVKLSAAWLIEYSGVQKGFSLPGSNASVSAKHSLALTNRGGATAAQIAELARYVSQRVQAETGVILQPEAILFGLLV